MSETNARDLGPEETHELLERGGQLVDVREDREWDAGRIPGSRHIELNQLTARSGELDRARPVVFLCRSGDRSAMAADAFRQAGWDSHNLAGGLVAWVEAGRPLEPEDGDVLDRRGRPAD